MHCSAATPPLHVLPGPLRPVAPSLWAAAHTHTPHLYEGMLYNSTHPVPWLLRKTQKPACVAHAPTVAGTNHSRTCVVEDVPPAEQPLAGAKLPAQHPGLHLGHLGPR